MKIDLNQKTFGLLSNSENGQVSRDTLFYYLQEGELVTATYRGGSVVSGAIVGKWKDDNKIDLLYHCLTSEGELKAGKAIAVASITEDGKTKLALDWQWFTDDLSKGQSEYVEIG